MMTMLSIGRLAACVSEWSLFGQMATVDGSALFSRNLG